MTDIPELRDIPVSEVHVVISRARAKPGFDQLKSSMSEVGLRFPIQVRDRGRVVKEGNRYELICGQGRLTAAIELGWKRIPALVVETSEAEFAGRFLAENMIRKPLAWAQKGRMIRDRMKATGNDLGAVAKALHISEAHARKYLRVLDKTAHELEDDVAAMPMNDAEVFTTLPPRGQKIVMEVVRETGAPVREIAKKAREIAQKDGAGWTKSALQTALSKIESDLKKARERRKLLNLHVSLGPENISVLLRNKPIRDALEKAGVNLSKFEES